MDIKIGKFAILGDGGKPATVARKGFKLTAGGYY